MEIFTIIAALCQLHGSNDSAWIVSAHQSDCQAYYSECIVTSKYKSEKAAMHDCVIKKAERDKKDRAYMNKKIEKMMGSTSSTGSYQNSTHQAE